MIVCKTPKPDCVCVPVCCSPIVNCCNSTTDCICCSNCCDSCITNLQGDNCEDILNNMSHRTPREEFSPCTKMDKFRFRNRTPSLNKFYSRSNSYIDMRRNNSKDKFCLPDQNGMDSMNEYDENNIDECNDVNDMNNRKDMDYLKEMNNYPIEEPANDNNDYMDNISSNINSKRINQRNSQRNYSYTGRTNQDNRDYNNRMKCSKDDLLDKIRYMTNRIDKVVEQYRDKDLCGDQSHFQNNYKTHQNKKNKNKFNISASSKRDDCYNFKKRNRTKNMGKYIDENQFKIDYSKKIKFLKK